MEQQPVRATGSLAAMTARNRTKTQQERTMMTRPASLAVRTLPAGLSAACAVTASVPEGRPDPPDHQGTNFVFIPKVVIHPVRSSPRRQIRRRRARQGRDQGQSGIRPSRRRRPEQPHRGLISASPDGSPSPATGDQRPAPEGGQEAGVNTITFNSFCSDEFPFVGREEQLPGRLRSRRFLFRSSAAGRVGIPRAR